MHETSNTAFKKECFGLTSAEENCFVNFQQLMEEDAKANNEAAMVGAATGGGFANATDSKPVKHEEDMQGPDRDKCKKAAEEEHERMMQRKVWKPVPRKDTPPNATTLTSAWAMKKKSTGTCRARSNARGCEAIDGEHCASHNTAAPVADDMTIGAMLVLMTMALWAGKVSDVKGAFLHGDFNQGKDVCMEVPHGLKSVVIWHFRCCCCCEQHLD